MLLDGDATDIIMSTIPNTVAGSAMTAEKSSRRKWKELISNSNLNLEQPKNDASCFQEHSKTFSYPMKKVIDALTTYLLASFENTPNRNSLISNLFQRFSNVLHSIY